MQRCIKHQFVYSDPRLWTVKSAGSSVLFLRVSRNALFSIVRSSLHHYQYLSRGARDFSHPGINNISFSLSFVCLSVSKAAPYQTPRLDVAVTSFFFFPITSAFARSLRWRISDPADSRRELAMVVMVLVLGTRAYAANISQHHLSSFERWGTARETAQSL